MAVSFMKITKHAFSFLDPQEHAFGVWCDGFDSLLTAFGTVT